MTCLPNAVVISSLAEEIIWQIDAGKNFLMDWQIRIELFYLTCASLAILCFYLRLNSKCII